VRELLWVYHIEMIDHLCERAPLSISDIEMKEHLCERAPLGISYRNERASL
jgi:hypothetical protein